MSSRAALFGDEDSAGSSSSAGEDDEDQPQQDQEEEQPERGRPQFTSPSRLRVVAVSPSRDLTRVSEQGGCLCALQPARTACTA